jgi:membrane fusion protein (multidrug efflux system)
MKKAFVLVTLGLVVVIGGLAGIKVLQIKAMIDQGKRFKPQPEVVTSAPVTTGSWETLLNAVGSLDAVQGVTVTAEMNGKVTQIAFKAGSRVAAGDLLVQQDISVEKAQLKSAESVSELARIEFTRSSQLLAKETVSQSVFDTAQAKLTQSLAQEEIIRATIAKKTIRAPFDGRLGVRQINLGQVINEGQPIVGLQSLDPLFVNFHLPQQQLALIRPGLKIRVSTDALPGQVFTCDLATIDPEVDAATRSIRIQAVLANPEEKLRAGMYVNVTVVLPKHEEVMTIPATAVLFAPYGDSVFVIEDTKGEGETPPGKSLRQQFVRLGEKRGDYVMVISGLKPEESVVSTGVFKLRNNQSVVVDNTLAPKFNLSPTPSES